MLSEEASQKKEFREEEFNETTLILFFTVHCVRCTDCAGTHCRAFPKCPEIQLSSKLRMLQTDIATLQVWKKEHVP